MRVDVSNYPEEWKTDKNLRWWLSKREDESVMVPDEIWVREDEAVEFAKQFHAPEIKKLETLLKLEREDNRNLRESHDEILKTISLEWWVSQFQSPTKAYESGVAALLHNKEMQERAYRALHNARQAKQKSQEIQKRIEEVKNG